MSEMNKKQESEINALSENQLKTLFWQVYGWMLVNHKNEMNMAVESAMVDARRVGI